MPEHTHTADGPETCFGCKARYWKANGGLSVVYPYGGQTQFHNTTVKESTDKMFRLAKQNGINPEPAGPSVWT